MCPSFRMFYQQFHNSECIRKKIDSSECSNTATGEYVRQPGAPVTRGGKGEPALMLQAASEDVRESSDMCCK
jgi:hypothetical protein